MRTEHPFFLQLEKDGQPVKRETHFQYLPSERWLRDGLYTKQSWLGLYACVTKKHDYRINVLESSGLFVLSCDRLFAGARVITTDEALDHFLAECKFPVYK